MQHQKWHTDVMLECRLCGSRLPNEVELKKHTNNRHLEEAWACVCGSVFSHERSLRSHIRKSTEGDHRPEE